MNEFQLIMKQTRAKNFLTQKDAARRLGVPLETYKCWEQGRCLPNARHLAMLYSSFEVREMLDEYMEQKEEQWERESENHKKPNVDKLQVKMEEIWS